MPYHELWRFVPPDQTEFIAIIEAPDFDRACRIHNARVGGTMTRSLGGIWSYMGERVWPSKLEASRFNEGSQDGRPKEGHPQQAHR
jgi:hypothetical protein